MANYLPQIETDEIRHLTTESEEPIRLVSVKSDDARTLVAVDQGGIKHIDYEVYEGPYEATPTSAEQTLDTDNKVLTADVTVHATPYSEVSTAGTDGYTVTIL